MRKRAVGVILASVLFLSACTLGPDLAPNNESDIEDTASEEDAADAQKKAVIREELKLRDRFVSTCEMIFPDKIQRYLTWELRDCAENNIGSAMVPILDENGTQDLSWFCEDICDWMEQCTKEIPYEETPWQYKESS